MPNGYYSLPCERLKYTKKVGELLPKILGKIFAELGFDAGVNSQQENGVDLEIYKDNNLVLVVEVLNWSIWSRLNTKRKNKITENLSKFRCNKWLIYTVPLSGISTLIENGIELVRIG